MATSKQVQAAKRNVRKAQRAATRRELGKQAARGRSRGGSAGHALEDRNRQQLYETARKLEIPGRSKMGKWELIDAIRRAR